MSFRVGLTIINTAWTCLPNQLELFAKRAERFVVSNWFGGQFAYTPVKLAVFNSNVFVLRFSPRGSFGGDNNSSNGIWAKESHFLLATIIAGDLSGIVIIIFIDDVVVVYYDFGEIMCLLVQSFCTCEEQAEQSHNTQVRCRSQQPLSVGRTPR